MISLNQTDILKKVTLETDRMIRDENQLKIWKNNYIRSQPIDVAHHFRLYEALYNEACALGLFPLKNPLEDLPVKTRLAKILNVSTTP